MSIIKLIFESILYPFVLLISSVFEFAYSICGNYGVSLILLSFFITLVTAPLYYFAEKWKNQEKKAQKKMHNDIQSINANFDGQKRFYLTKTARKIYKYKWWYSFRTSLGLIIQIPFFFAAYEVLSKYTGYQGVSFLFVNDLSKPDMLFAGMNILPFIMTIVNVAYSIYYTKSVKWKANKDLYILAGVFLVLLYNSPAALLIYWTMNNVFSFVKGVILRKAGLSEVPIILENKNAKPAKQIIKENLNVLYFFFFILACSLQVYWIIHSPKTFKYCIAVMLFLAMLSSITVLLIKRDKKTFWNLFFRWLAFMPVMTLFLFGRKYNPFISNANIKLFTSFFLNYLFVTSFKLYYHEDVQLKNNIVLKTNASLVLFIVFWIGIYLPLLYYTSDPHLANIKLSAFFFQIITISLIMSSVLVLIYHLINKKHKHFYNMILIYAILNIIVYSIFLKLDTGQLDLFKFQKQQNLYENSLIFYIIDAFVLSFLLFIAKQISLKKISLFKVLSIIIPFVLSITIIYRVHNMPEFKVTEYKETLNPVLYENHKLSKNGTNIIVILADMFNGNYVQKLIDKEPEYKNKLDGFVYYPDCLSVSKSTLKSLPGIFGGKKAALEALSYKDDLKEDEYIKAIGEKADILFSQLHNKNFTITISNNSNIYKKLDYVNIDSYSDYRGYWRKKNNFPQIQSNTYISKLYILLSVFQSLPYHLKPVIYDDSGWLIFRQESTIDAQSRLCIDSVAQLDILPQVSSVDVNQGDTILYLHSLLSHTPWCINEDNKILNNEYIKQNYADTFNKCYSKEWGYYSAKKLISLLSNYTEWLKKNDVYDNTVIFVISDHGNDRLDNDIPIPENIEYTDIEYNLSFAQTLMLIKEKNSSGPLKISNLQMSLYDLPAMLSTEAGIKFLDDKDPRFDKNNQNRARMYFAPALKENKKNMYYVTGSIFEPSSWSMTPPEGSGGKK